VPPLPAECVQWTDYELGGVLIGLYVAAVAVKNRIPLDAMPLGFAEAVLAAVQELETDSAKLAAPLLALRKAALGDFETAGKLTKEYMLAGAQAIAYPRLVERLSLTVRQMQPDADRGRKTISAASEGGDEKAKLYEPEKRRVLARAREIEKTRKRRKPGKRELARLVVEAEYPDLTGEAAEKKADVIRHWL
jgi:hypothetical protein